MHDPRVSLPALVGEGARVDRFGLWNHLRYSSSWPAISISGTFCTEKKRNCQVGGVCTIWFYGSVPGSGTSRIASAGPTGPRDRSKPDSVKLDRSVQEICWLYSFAGSNPVLTKPFIRADSKLVGECRLTGMLSSIIYIDLVNLGEQDAQHPTRPRVLGGRRALSPPR